MLDSDSSYGAVVRMYLFHHQRLSKTYEYLFYRHFYYYATLISFSNYKQIKVDEHIKAKLYVKLKPPKMNMYRQYFCFNFSLIYYLVIASKLK